MKTFTLKNALVLSVLTLASALASTSSAQAAPNHRADDRKDANPAWNNNSRYDAPSAQQPRFDNRNVYNQPHSDNRDTPAPRSVPFYSQQSYSGPRDNSRRDFDRGRNYRDNYRDNYRHDNDNSVTGAILGAIIGSVLSR